MPTILVADDNSNIQKMVSLVFEEKGIRVVAVGNGEAACRKMSEVRPDIVLADVFMPVRSGYEVCEFVKHDSQFAGIPVILLVGAFDPLDEKEARRVGADGVLKKPFVPPDPLIAMVTSLLPKVEPPVAEPAAPPKEEVPEPPAWMPKPRPPIPEFEEPEGVPPEFALGTAAKDFEPVATPAPKPDAEEEEDYADPTREWRRRRSTMDYEIPAAESASMVEKLSGQDTAEDLPFLESTGAPEPAHVPFGRENVPEKIDPIPPPSATEWMDLMGITATKKAHPVEETREASAPAESAELAQPDASTAAPAPVNEPSNNSSINLPTSLLSISPEGTAPPYASHEEPSQHEASSRHEERSQHEEPPPRGGSSQRDDRRLESASAQQTDWPAPPAEVIPFPAPAELAPTSTFEIPSDARDAEIIVQETRVQKFATCTAENLNAATVGPEKFAPEKTRETPTEVSATDSPVHSESQEKESHAEVAGAAPAKPAEMDSAAIDSMVAKLLEKLEPQIHLALSNGVLRPLVEEMLNREREKK